MSDANPSESATARKVRSLLDINKTLAKENTFLSQQVDVLSKECVSLAHLLRSRQLLNGAREMELKSALEAAKQAVQRKDDALRHLEDRVRQLEERVRPVVEVSTQITVDTREESWNKENMGVEREMAVMEMSSGTTGKTGGRDSRRVERPATRTSKLPKSSESCRCPISPRFTKSPDLAYLEANHPWLSPVLLRLEQLSNDSDSEFKVSPNKRFSPGQNNGNTERVEKSRADIDLTLSRDEDSKDAGSCTYRMDNIQQVNEQMAYMAERGLHHTPEPFSCHLSPRGDLPSVQEDNGSPRIDQGKPRERCQGLGRSEAAVVTPVTGLRSSLRRRKTVNYALPSLNAKLRQGDAHTFGTAAESGRGITPRRKH